MDNFRKNFFQVLLLILALTFTVCVKYLNDTECVSAGTFGAAGINSITFSDMFSGLYGGER